MNSSEEIQTEDLGEIDYESAWQHQRGRAHAVASRAAAEVIYVCTHPEVVTLGRRTEAADVAAWTGSRVEVNRGGRATYHGPGQLVMYPIIDLDRHKLGVLGYLDLLEKSVIQLLFEEFGLETGGGRSQHVPAVDESLVRGVWHRGRKVASLGVAVSRSVTTHGAALNLRRIGSFTRQIRPCGLSADMMTSVEEILDIQMSDAQCIQIRRQWPRAFANLL